MNETKNRKFSLCFAPCYPSLGYDPSRFSALRYRSVSAHSSSWNHVWMYLHAECMLSPLLLLLLLLVLLLLLAMCLQQFCEWVLVLFYWPIFYGRQWRRCYALYHNKQNVLLRFLTGYRVLWKQRLDRGSCAHHRNSNNDGTSNGSDNNRI